MSSVGTIVAGSTVSGAGATLTSARGLARAGASAVAFGPVVATASGFATVLGVSSVLIAGSSFSVTAGSLRVSGVSALGDSSRYAAFFLGSAASVVQLELVEISHPNFTQTYRLVRNSRAGFNATLEDGTQHFFEYYPLKLTPKATDDDLDQGFSISFGDLGEILPQEMDAVARADGWSVKPTVIYRTYRSDDSTQPLFGPLTLQVTTFSFKREGATFEAVAPLLNYSQTGQLYQLDVFPALRGTL